VFTSYLVYVWVELPAGWESEEAVLEAVLVSEEVSLAALALSSDVSVFTPSEGLSPGLYMVTLP
jgi:hypothetical protein